MEPSLLGALADCRVVPHCYSAVNYNTTLQHNNRFHCLKSGPLKGPAWLGTASRNDIFIHGNCEVKNDQVLNSHKSAYLVLMDELCGV